MFYLLIFQVLQQNWPPLSTKKKNDRMISSDFTILGLSVIVVIIIANGILRVPLVHFYHYLIITEHSEK